MSAADVLINIAVNAVLTPLVARVRDLAAPVLVYIPDELEDAAVEALDKLAADLLREGLALLMAHGKLTITTTGEIAITHHVGAHPNDTEV